MELEKAWRESCRITISQGGNVKSLWEGQIYVDLVPVPNSLANGCLLSSGYDAKCQKDDSPRGTNSRSPT